ncbi:hypothetical protein DL770_005370 [Monosporascus sp. CRB-9-2]|nr:hypothetical protein DL770_005370 [Monosporascus sp. CRB-9-2]
MAMTNVQPHQTVGTQGYGLVLSELKSGWALKYTAVGAQITSGDKEDTVSALFDIPTPVNFNPNAKLQSLSVTMTTPSQNKPSVTELKIYKGSELDQTQTGPWTQSFTANLTQTPAPAGAIGVELFLKFPVRTILTISEVNLTVA